jgi:hypothetical protein
VNNPAVGRGEVPHWRAVPTFAGMPRSTIGTSAFVLAVTALCIKAVMPGTANVAPSISSVTGHPPQHVAWEPDESAVSAAAATAESLADDVTPPGR